LWGGNLGRETGRDERRKGMLDEMKREKSRRMTGREPGVESGEGEMVWSGSKVDED